METERLRQFCIVVESGGLSKAADLLNISIGGLSKSIKVLEAELGFPILLPSGRGLVVSDKGKEVYVRAKQILEMAAALKKDFVDTGTPFRIGSLEVFTIHLMGPLIKLKFATSKIEVIELTPGILEIAVLDGKLDCGITYMPKPQAGLELLKLGHFELGAFAIRNLYKDIPFQEIPFIVPPTGITSNPLGITERDGWPDEAVERLKIHKVNMLSTALDLARQGLGAVFMPRFVAHLHNETQAAKFQLESIPLPKNLTKIRHEIFLVKRESSFESPEIKKLTSGIRTILQKQDLSVQRSK